MTATAKVKNTFVNLQQLIMLHSQFEECLKSQVRLGFLAQFDADTLLHDYLNETSGLFDDEYHQVKEVVLKQDFLDPDFNCNICDNPHDLLSAVSDSQDEICFLVNLWEELKNNAEEGLIAEDECCDQFGELLFDRGIDYATFVDLCNIEWVKEDV